MKKRIFSVMLMLLMTLGLSSNSFAAGDKAVLSVSNVKAKVNDKVMVDIDISNPSGCAGGSVCVEYDPNILEAVSYTNGAAFGKISPNVNLDYSSNTIKFNWMSSTTLVSGNLISLEFKALKPGVCDVLLKSINLSTVQVKSIPYEVQNGSVDISSDFSVELYKNSQKVQTIDTGTYSIRVKIADDALSGRTGNVFVGAYNDRGALKSICGSKKLLSTDKSVEVPVDISDGVAYIKVFIWDENMNPFTKTVTYEK